MEVLSYAPTLGVGNILETEIFITLTSDGWLGSTGSRLKRMEGKRRIFLIDIGEGWGGEGFE